MKLDALQGFLRLIYFFSILFKKYLFIWLCQVLVVACRILQCGARAQELPCRTWDLSEPGIEPSSPALEGRFLSTVPPGKSCWGWFKCPCLVGTCTLLGTISAMYKGAWGSTHRAPTIPEISTLFLVSYDTSASYSIKVLPSERRCL